MKPGILCNTKTADDSSMDLSNVLENTISESQLSLKMWKTSSIVITERRLSPTHHFNSSSNNPQLLSMLCNPSSNSQNKKNIFSSIPPLDRVSFLLDRSMLGYRYSVVILRKKSSPQETRISQRYQYHPKNLVIS